jgi:hypothetical protein
MKFKKLITESVIDNLDISKQEKAILKTFNIVDDDKNTYSKIELDLSDGEKMVKVSEMTGVNDLDKIYSLYKFFIKYKDLLFKDNISNIEYGTLDINDKDMLSTLLLKYFNDNFNGKTIFKVRDGEFKVGLMFDLQEQIAEETYSIIGYFESNNTLPNVVFYCGIFNDTGKGMSWDFITHDEELGEFNAKHILKKGKYEEVIDSGYINIPTFKNLSNESLNEYFSRLFNSIEDSVLEDMWVIEEYMEWINNR